MFCIACALFVTFTFCFFREGEDWNRMRKALAPKMLRPKDVRDNMDNFTAVTRDAIEHMVSIRGIDMEIPDLDKELAKWATECKCLLLSKQPVISEPEGGGGVLPLMAYTGRFCPRGVSFSGLKYMKG